MTFYRIDMNCQTAKFCRFRSKSKYFGFLIQNMDLDLTERDLCSIFAGHTFTLRTQNEESKFFPVPPVHGAASDTSNLRVCWFALQGLRRRVYAGGLQKRD